MNFEKKHSNFYKYIYDMVLNSKLLSFYKNGQKFKKTYIVDCVCKYRNKVLRMVNYKGEVECKFNLEDLLAAYNFLVSKW